MQYSRTRDVPCFNPLIPLNFPNMWPTLPMMHLSHWDFMQLPQKHFILLSFLYAAALPKTCRHTSMCKIGGATSFPVVNSLFYHNNCSCAKWLNWIIRKRKQKSGLKPHQIGIVINMAHRGSREMREDVQRERFLLSPSASNQIGQPLLFTAGVLLFPGGGRYCRKNNRRCLHSL